MLLVLLLAGALNAGELDDHLSALVITFKYAAVEEKIVQNQALFDLGEQLFFDKNLSIKKNISCADCHHPDSGSADGLPFSIGEGGSGQGHKRFQSRGVLTSRSAPTLYNKGHSDFQRMFWDGRVFKSTNGELYTPEPKLNGAYPDLPLIAHKLESVMAAQALFPLVTDIEMKGNSDLSNEEVWTQISDRVKINYKQAVTELFTNFNIADIANALAYYQTHAFQVFNTPWDKYLRGNKNAISDSEKRGAIVFSEKAACSRCHHGKHLTNFAFQNIGVPSISTTRTSALDKGRAIIAKDDRFNFAFATPPLRNIALTAPYFHNGSYSTLEDVLDHYINQKNTTARYDVVEFNLKYQDNYNDFFYFLDTNSTWRQKRQTLHPLLRGELNLSFQEKRDLLKFLSVSLTGS